MTSSDSRQFINGKVLSIHIGLWFIYLLSEFFANLYHYPKGAYGDLIRDILLSLPVMLVATYFIAYVLVPNFLRKNRIGLFILFTLLTSLIVFWGRVYWLSTINYLDGGSWMVYPPSKILKNVIRDYSVIGLAVCLKIIGDWYRKDRLNRQLRRANAEAKLNLLKSQLHPHFLFNTLNNLYGLALRQSEDTAKGILRLSQILDYLLYSSSKDRVPLHQEVELIENYFDLERLRQGKNLQLDIDYPPVPEFVQVAPVLLLPFVENCFKHGGKNDDGKCWIKTSLSINGPTIYFTIINSTPRFKEERHGGLGLENIHNRLQILYPNQHSLTIDQGAGFFSVRLTFQWTTKEIAQRRSGVNTY